MRRVAAVLAAAVHDPPSSPTCVELEQGPPVFPRRPQQDRTGRLHRLVLHEAGDDLAGERHTMGRGRDAVERRQNVTYGIDRNSIGEQPVLKLGVDDDDGEQIGREGQGSTPRPRTKAPIAPSRRPWLIVAPKVHA